VLYITFDIGRQALSRAIGRVSGRGWRRIRDTEPLGALSRWAPSGRALVSNFRFTKEKAA
jgi:hypothetical protein